MKSVLVGNESSHVMPRRLHPIQEPSVWLTGLIYRRRQVRVDSLLLLPIFEPVQSHCTDKSILYCWEFGSICYTLRYKPILFSVFVFCSVVNFLRCNLTRTEVCLADNWDLRNWKLFYQNVRFCTDNVQFLINRNWTELNDSCWRNISRWQILLIVQMLFYQQ